MNLYQKILEVMKGVSYLSKDDTVAFGNTKYKAVSEEKVTSTVREKLIEQERKGCSNGKQQTKR